MWNKEQRLGDAMEMAWGNLFRYVEDFIALTLNFRLKPEFSLVRVEVPLTSPDSTWHWTDRKTADEFISKNAPARKI
jgi:hypothetical protein